MALGRPINNDTQYKVIVLTLGKYRYASTKVFTVGEDGINGIPTNIGGQLTRETDSILE